MNASGSAGDRLKYPCDRNSNPICRENTLSAGHGKTFIYNNLNRLVVCARGPVSLTGVTHSAATRIGTTTVSSTSDMKSNLSRYSLPARRLSTTT